MDDADIAILAVRLQGYRIFYVDFKQLRRLGTSGMKLKYSSDEKWRSYIWENYIKVRGNDAKVDLEAEMVSVKSGRMVHVNRASQCGTERHELKPEEC